MRSWRQGVSGYARVPLALDCPGCVCSAGRVRLASMQFALDRRVRHVPRAQTRCVRQCVLVRGAVVASGALSRVCVGEVRRLPERLIATSHTARRGKATAVRA